MWFLALPSLHPSTFFENVFALHVYLGLNQGGWQEDYKSRHRPLNFFLSSIDKSISMREGKEYKEEVDSEVRYLRYKTFSET